MAVNFGEILSTTIRHYRAQLTENITTTEALFWQLNKKGRMVEVSGGQSIVEPLMYAENSQIQSYSGADEFTLARQDVIDAAEFNWKQIVGSMSYHGLEEFKNSSSRERIISLIESKLKNLELSMQLELNRQLFLDGTGNGGKDLTGLAAAIEDGTAYSTYGGIDSSTYSFWQNYWAGAVGAFGTGLNAAGILAMRLAYYSCSRGQDHPDIGFTTQTVYSLYETALGSAVRIISDNFKNAGFEDNLMFKGMTLFYDADAPSQAMTMINTNYLKLTVGKGKNFAMLEKVRPANQDMYSVPVLLYGNLSLSNRRRQARLDAITA